VVRGPIGPLTHHQRTPPCLGLQSRPWALAQAVATFPLEGPA